MKKPRILYICNDTSFFVSHRLPLAAAASRAGFEVGLAALDTGDLEPLCDHGVQFHPIHLDRTGLNPVSDAAYLLRLARLIRKFQPDLVHTVTVKPVLYGGVLARLMGVPAVVAAMSGLGFLYTSQSLAKRITRAGVQSIQRFAMRHPNARVIFQNPHDRDQLIAAGMAPSANAVLIRGSGVDPAAFPAQAPSGNGAGGPPVVLLPARLLWDKGVGEFVEAARILKREGVAARFVLAGDRAIHNRAAVPEATIRQWQDEGAVEWWGHRQDMAKVFAAARIVCLPSYREGLPKVLLEAASSSRAIVTTDVPGCRETVRDGENGVLVPPRQAVPLAKAIARLLADPARCDAFGRRGRELVVQEFALDKVVAATLALYEELGVLAVPQESESAAVMAAARTETAA